MLSRFDGRVFLLESEHETYLRRMPVRYTKKLKTKFCEVCGLEGTKENPIENAHRIPFSIGVKVFKLTPDYLDKETNLVSAHRKICNKSVELSYAEIAEVCLRLNAL